MNEKFVDILKLELVTENNVGEVRQQKWQEGNGWVNVLSFRVPSFINCPQLFSTPPNTLNFFTPQIEDSVPVILNPSNDDF